MISVWLRAVIAASFALALSSSAFGQSTLTSWDTLPQYFRSQISNSGLFVKGVGVDTWYALEVNPATGELPVTGSFTFSGLLDEDHNYGVVGANTLRTAAEIGNATGAADFGTGAVSAQTLRVVSVLSTGSAGLSYGAGTTGATSLRVVLPTDQTAIPVTGSFSSAAVGSTGSAVPASADYGGMNVGGTLTGLQGTANGLKVDGSAVTQPVSGTVTANIGTTNGLALDATVAKLNVAQAAALGANTGPLIQGSVTTAAPTYTAGTISPLSLTPGGALRVDDSGVTGTVNLATAAATFQAEGSIVFGSLTSTYATAFTTAGAMKLLQLRSSLNVPVYVSLDGGVTTHYVLEQGDAINIDLRSDNMTIASGTAVQAKYTGSAPTFGTLHVNGAY